jgi:hypothetical protein
VSDSRPEVLVVLHDVDDNLNELAPPLAEAGLRIITWDVERDPGGAPALDALERFSGIISLGAYAGVPDEPKHPWMTHEKQLMTRALETGMPVLGLCFGSQLLASTCTTTTSTVMRTGDAIESRHTRSVPPSPSRYCATRVAPEREQHATWARTACSQRAVVPCPS